MGVKCHYKFNIPPWFILSRFRNAPRSNSSYNASHLTNLRTSVHPICVISLRPYINSTLEWSSPAAFVSCISESPPYSPQSLSGKCWSCSSNMARFWWKWLLLNIVSQFQHLFETSPYLDRSRVLVQCLLTFDLYIHTRRWRETLESIWTLPGRSRVKWMPRINIYLRQTCLAAHDKQTIVFGKY